MEKWSLDLQSEFMKSVYGSYLSRIDHITTLYSVVAFNETLMSCNPDKLDDSFKVALSTDFGNWATIKTKRDVMNSIKSGHLHQINCYQALVSLASNFEDLVERLVKHCSVGNNDIANATPQSLNGVVKSPILQKIHAIHNKFSIHSNVIGKHETGYYYKMIKLRNCIVHRQGIPNTSESNLLQHWISGGRISFNRDQIDDFVHFFLMPLTSMITELDKKFVPSAE